MNYLSLLLGLGTEQLYTYYFEVRNFLCWCFLNANSLRGLSVVVTSHTHTCTSPDSPVSNEDVSGQSWRIWSGDKRKEKNLVFYFWLEPNFPLSQSDNRCQAEKIMSCECYVFQQRLVWGREWGNWGTRGREPGISTTSASLVTASEIVETQKLASFSALFPPFCL